MANKYANAGEFLKELLTGVARRAPDPDLARRADDLAAAIGANNNRGIVQILRDKELSAALNDQIRALGARSGIDVENVKDLVGKYNSGDISIEDLNTLGRHVDAPSGGPRTGPGANAADAGADAGNAAGDAGRKTSNAGGPEPGAGKKQDPNEASEADNMAGGAPDTGPKTQAGAGDAAGDGAKSGTKTEPGENVGDTTGTKAKDTETPEPEGTPPPKDGPEAKNAAGSARQAPDADDTASAGKAAENASGFTGRLRSVGGSIWHMISEDFRTHPILHTLTWGATTRPGLMVGAPATLLTFALPEDSFLKKTAGEFFEVWSSSFRTYGSFAAGMAGFETDAKWGFLGWDTPLGFESPPEITFADGISEENKQKIIENTTDAELRDIAGRMPGSDTEISVDEYTAWSNERRLAVQGAPSGQGGGADAGDDESEEPVDLDSVPQHIIDAANAPGGASTQTPSTDTLTAPDDAAAGRSGRSMLEGMDASRLGDAAETMIAGAATGLENMVDYAFPGDDNSPVKRTAENLALGTGGFLKGAFNAARGAWNDMSPTAKSVVGGLGLGLIGTFLGSKVLDFLKIGKWPVLGSIAKLAIIPVSILGGIGLVRRWGDKDGAAQGSGQNIPSQQVAPAGTSQSHAGGLPARKVLFEDPNDQELYEEIVAVRDQNTGQYAIQIKADNGQTFAPRGFGNTPVLQSMDNGIYLPEDIMQEIFDNQVTPRFEAVDNDGDGQLEAFRLDLGRGRIFETNQPAGLAVQTLDN